MWTFTIKCCVDGNELALSAGSTCSPLKIFDDSRWKPQKIKKNNKKESWLKWPSGLTGGNPNEMKSNMKGERCRDWTNLILCHICLYSFLKVALLLCCSSQARFIAPLSRFLPWLWVSLYWSRSFSHGPRSSADCRLRRMYLMVCCALLYCIKKKKPRGCMAAARLFFFFSFFLYYPPTAGFICPLALITIKPFWLMPLFPGFHTVCRRTQSTLPSAQSSAHQQDVIQSR